MRLGTLKSQAFESKYPCMTVVSHPHCLRLLQAGATSIQPAYVMESLQNSLWCQFSLVPLRWLRMRLLLRTVLIPRLASLACARVSSGSTPFLLLLPCRHQATFNGHYPGSSASISNDVTILQSFMLAVTFPLLPFHAMLEGPFGLTPLKAAGESIRFSFPVDNTDGEDKHDFGWCTWMIKDHIDEDVERESELAGFSSRPSNDCCSKCPL